MCTTRHVRHIAPLARVPASRHWMVISSYWEGSVTVAFRVCFVLIGLHVDGAKKSGHNDRFFVGNLGIRMGSGLVEPREQSSRVHRTQSHEFVTICVPRLIRHSWIRNPDVPKALPFGVVDGPSSFRTGSDTKLHEILTSCLQQCSLRRSRLTCMTGFHFLKDHRAGLRILLVPASIGGNPTLAEGGTRKSAYFA